MDNSLIRAFRKKISMTQRELSERLNMRQSFLSAIESGRCKMPEKKLDLMMEQFPEFREMAEAASNAPAAAPEASVSKEEDNDLSDISRLLNHFHDRAHRDGAALSDAHMSARIEALEHRNDVLSAKNDELRETIDRLREEIYRLRIAQE